MNFRRILTLGLVAGAVGACGDDDGPTGIEPIGGVRFVNVLPDTVALDFRVIRPTITHTPQSLEHEFREFSQHWPVAVGTHEVRAFFSGLDSRDEDDVQIVIAEAEPSFTQGVNRSVVAMGFARDGQTPAMEVLITDDTPPERVDGQYHLRVLHAGAGLPAMNVYVRPSGDPNPATATIADVAYGEVTAYVGLPVVRSADEESDTLEVVAVPVGGGAEIVAKLPLGSEGNVSTEGSAGTRFAGGALTILITPPTVAGSRAPQDTPPDDTFSNPAIVILSDRRTPMTQ